MLWEAMVHLEENLQKRPLACCSGFNTDINGTRPGSEGSNSTGIKFVAGFDSKGHEHGKDVIIIFNTRIMVLVE